LDDLTVLGDFIGIDRLLGLSFAIGDFEPEFGDGFEFFEGFFKGFTLGEATLEHGDFSDKAAFFAGVEGDRVFHGGASAN
jgi:hypothetical protein